MHMYINNNKKTGDPRGQDRRGWIRTEKATATTDIHGDTHVARAHTQARPSLTERQPITCANCRPRHSARAHSAHHAPARALIGETRDGDEIVRQPREDELGRRALAAGVEGARRRPGRTRAVDERQGLVRLEPAAGKVMVRSR